MISDSDFIKVSNSLREMLCQVCDHAHDRCVKLLVARARVSSLIPTPCMTCSLIPTPCIIDRGALAKQGDNAFGSVRPCVCLLVSALMTEPFDL